MDYSWRTILELSSRLTEMLEAEHPGLVTDLHVATEGDTLVLRGEVASEHCRGDAKRFALAFHGIFKVRNELVVAAFLEAASDPDLDNFFGRRRSHRDTASDGSRSEAKREDRGASTRQFKGDSVPDGPATPNFIEVTRHPVVEANGSLRPSEWVGLTIDLSKDTQPGSQSISIGKFPPDWDRIAITVQVIVPWASETVAENASATIFADGNSEPARFRCLVSSEYVEGSPAQVHAVFSHGTRICGHIAQDLAAAPAEVPDAAVPKPSSPSTTPEFRIAPDTIGPEVSITILGSGERFQTWIWEAFVPGGVMSGSGKINLGGDEKKFADSLLSACPGLSAIRFQRTLDGIGERLWDVSPSEFRDAYTSWRATIGTSFAIQFITDDPYVPWEMMKPRLPGAKHLFLEHPVARWPLLRAGRRRARFEGGDLLSFVPRYEEQKYKALKFAAAEGEWICSELGGLAMSANTDIFLGILDGEHSSPVGMLHFAGHGQEDSGVGNGGIEMEDGVVSVADVHQDRVVLGQRDGTLMVLNACETSAGARLLGMNVGWGAAIADREFGGLIAPLWEVQDEAALAMMKSALPCLLDCTQTLGEALTGARLANSSTSVAAYAYLAHGDVMARFVLRP